MRWWATCKTAGLKPTQTYCLSVHARLFAPLRLIVPSRSSLLGQCVGRTSLAGAGVRPMFFVIPRQPPCCGKEHRCRTLRLSSGTVQSRLRRSTPKWT